MSLKEAQELFTKEFEETAIGLSKFCSLRPFQDKLFEKIPRNVCVFQYHENIHLSLQFLNKILMWQQLYCALSVKWRVKKRTRIASIIDMAFVMIPLRCWNHYLKRAKPWPNIINGKNKKSVLKRLQFQQLSMTCLMT